MQTGRDPVDSSDKPRDFPDLYQTTTCSLFSGDSQCAGWIQTFQVGLRDGTRDNRHAGLIVAVKLYTCETWQIREVASPQAGVQGRGGETRIKTSKLGLLLIGLYPPPLGDWATDKLYDWADKMVHAAPSRRCVVVGGDLNARVGYMRHPEREALNLERETMAGCGEYQRVHAIFNGERWSKFCRDQHMVMVNTHYRRGGPTYWNALRGKKIETGLHFASSHATSNGHTVFLSKRGPTLSAHSSPTPTCPLAADGKSKSEAAVWRRHNGSAICGGMGSWCNHTRSS